uniref:Uncharacterized protein n=1 Tax=Oryza rufipogon TaxID=4529 RepID=A0A0E0R0Q1_ORYRU
MLISLPTPPLLIPDTIATRAVVSKFTISLDPIFIFPTKTLNSPPKLPSFTSISGNGGGGGGSGDDSISSPHSTTSISNALKLLMSSFGWKLTLTHPSSSSLSWSASPTKSTSRSISTAPNSSASPRAGSAPTPRAKTRSSFSGRVAGGAPRAAPSAAATRARMPSGAAAAHASLDGLRAERSTQAARERKAQAKSTPGSGARRDGHRTAGWAARRRCSAARWGRLVESGAPWSGRLESRNRCSAATRRRRDRSAGCRCREGDAATRSCSSRHRARASPSSSETGGAAMSRPVSASSWGRSGVAAWAQMGRSIWAKRPGGPRDCDV